MLLAKLIQEGKGGLILELGGKGLPSGLLQPLDKINLKPFPCEVDAAALVLNDAVLPLSPPLNHFAEELLSQQKMVPIVGIGAVELTRGELRVMSLVDALVPEVFAYLEDLRDPSHHQSLQEELRCDPHEEVHFMVIVKSPERFLLANWVLQSPLRRKGTGLESPPPGSPFFAATSAG